MMDGYELVSRLTAELRQRMEEEKEALAGGLAKSFDDYMHRVGWIRGMEIALELLQEQKRAVNDARTEMLR